MHRDGEAPAAGTQTARDALDFIAAHNGSAIFHLKDFHEPLRESSLTRRRLRDIYTQCDGQGKFVVISSPVRYIPEEIERSVMFLELRPPDLVEMADFVREDRPGTSEDVVQMLAGALLGLTIEESRYALRRAIAVNPQLSVDSLPVLLEEKRMLVNRTGVIEFIADPTGIADVGGIEILKGWLLERRKLFQMRDSLSSEIVPKGILMMGIPGCGKSLCVKAIESTFGLPL